MGLIHNLEANAHLKGWYRGEKIDEKRDDFSTLREGLKVTKRRLMDLIGEYDKEHQELEARVKELRDQLDERYDYPRCGECDNVKICGVHDCEQNPLYSESQMCEDCAGCKTPQDDQHGGPCDPCKCQIEKDKHADETCWGVGFVVGPWCDKCADQLNWTKRRRRATNER